MPEQVRDLRLFLEETIGLLAVVQQCRAVLVEARLRADLSRAIEEAIRRLRGLSDHPYLQDPERYEEMEHAGLIGAQLNFKLASFESSLQSFQTSGRQDELAEVLDKSGIILSSLAGAIPGFGSFAQELIDFILKELKKRFWRRR
ncbi:hypothetical protein [Geothrix sp. 21YS21S-4]|uniref:hypothetical protein n=1 Tax=Geothrix sp. 21YS21S-4 TaxID=3068889 RepID=UPI0027B8F2A7|nr:hypothetical protein [Geothrix sp. 21YS21S-4]